MSRGSNLGPPNTLTAGELIAQLQEYPPDMPVVAVYDFGDYHHTPAVTGFTMVTEESLVQTGYSQSGWEAPGLLEEDGDEDSLPYYLVLR